MQRGPVERPRPPERPRALERARLHACEHAVAVGARQRVAPGVEPVRRGLGAPSTLRSSGSSPLSRDDVRRLALVARHLPAGVDAAVGASRDGDRQRPAGDRLERLLEHALDGAQARLPGPAGEARAVVLEQEPRGQRYPRLRATIWRYSPSMRTGPSPPLRLRTISRYSRVHGLELLGRERVARRHLDRGVAFEAVHERLRRLALPDDRAPLDLDPRRQALEALADRVLVSPQLGRREVGGRRRVAPAHAEELDREAVRRPGRQAHGVAGAHDPEQLAAPSPRAGARTRRRTPSRRSRSARPRTEAPPRRRAPTPRRSPRRRCAGAPRSTIAGARSLATTPAPSRAHASAKFPSPAATSSTSCPADTAQASQRAAAAGSSTRESAE